MDASTAASYPSDGLMSSSMYTSQSSGSTVNCFIKPSMLLDEATDSSSSSFFPSPSFGDELDFLTSTGNVVTPSSTSPIASSKASSTLLTVSVSSANNNNEQQASHHVHHQHLPLTSQHHHHHHQQQQQQHHPHHINSQQQVSHHSSSMDEGINGTLSSNNNPGNCDVNSSYNSTCNSIDLGEPLMMNHSAPSNVGSFNHSTYTNNGYIDYPDVYIKPEPSPYYSANSEQSYHVSTSASFSPDSSVHHHQHQQQQQQQQQHHHQQQMQMNGRDTGHNQPASFSHSSSNFYANHQVNSQQNMHMQPQHLQVDHQSPYFNTMNQMPPQQQPFYSSNVKSEFIANNELMCKSEGSPAARSASTPSSTASSSSLIESPSFYENSNFKVTGLPCNGPTSNMNVLTASSSTGTGGTSGGKSTAGLSTKGRHNLTSGAGLKGSNVVLVPNYHQQQSHTHMHLHHHQSLSPPSSSSSPGGNCKRESKKSKKRKDPNEPQKPVSAYALFFRDTQATIKGSQPNASFGEVSKIVASMWDSLDQESKTAYKNRTEQAKKEYLKALAVYRASQLPNMNGGTSGIAGGTSSLTSPNGPVRNSLTGPLQANGHHLHHSQAREQAGQQQQPQQQQHPQQQQQQGHQQPSPLQKRSPLLTSALQASSAAMSINPSDLEPSSPGSSSFNSYNNNGHNKHQQNTNTANCTGSNSILSNDQRIINSSSSSSSSSSQAHYVTDHQQQQQQQQNWTQVNGTAGPMSASSSSSSPSSSSPSNWPDPGSATQMMSSVSTSNNNNYTNGPNISININSNSTVAPITVSTATYTSHHSHTHHPVMAQVNSV